MVGLLRTQLGLVVVALVGGFHGPQAVAVVGLAHDMLGQVGAVIVLEPYADVTTEAIQADVREGVAAGTVQRRDVHSPGHHESPS